ncbi:hypothetical protein BDV96DRAFT_646292 [Lophiotrema nucula]|uniref:Mtf2-like C-terminal domain-containing protein n=1 Tax=Lophiotrema nucula TaxID=690887 RepID=A0A6A5Z753_9PLEO|nr:hypothetical protein BDV96DRAFT_646292 [Lophiotrema nucula]
MSHSRGAFRALSASRLHTYTQSPLPHRTLLPFLYQTATIQHCRPHRPSIACQYHTPGRRTTPDEDLPFEKPTSTEADDLPPSIEEDTDEAGLLPSRKSTVTATERVAFQKLYEKLGQGTRQGGDEDVPFAGREDGDMVFDEYYEEEDGAEDKADELGKVEEVFDKIGSQMPLPRAELKGGKGKRRQGVLKALADKEGNGRKSGDEKREEKEKLRVLREEARTRIVGLMEEAQTDLGLWQVLQSEVFEIIRALDLDKPVPAADKSHKTGKKKGMKTKAKAELSTAISEANTSEPTSNTSQPDVAEGPAADPRVLFPNYPQLLIHATTLLRTNFPTSHLPLSILPTIKSLGRSSFALGATTPLYNLLLSKTWSTYSTASLITELLSDMDNAGLTPNADTLQIIESILSEIKQGRSGLYGELISKVWSMDMGTQDASRLRGWRDALRQRLGVGEGASSGGVGQAALSRRAEGGLGLSRRVVQPGGFGGRPQKEAVVAE